MSTMQEALQEVGYKPHVRLRTLRRAEARLTAERAAKEALEQIIVNIFGQTLKVQVQRAGSRYRARYEGDSRSVFVDHPKEAPRILRLFCFGGIDREG